MHPGPLTDRQILERRQRKAALDPRRAYAANWEQERDAAGGLAATAVVFLTNRECPFRCVMCDLWVNTLNETVTDGAIVEQIRAALGGLPRARQIKLYNAGSFFDPHAIPPGDDEAIASVLQPFDRVIVEAHPAFLRSPYADRCLRFRDRLAGRLEVAIGLETAHPGVLERLDKRMTLDDYRGAAAFLRRHEIDVRTFILLQPPFLPAADAVEWGCRSIDVAFDAGTGVCSIIPTRSGTGGMAGSGALPPTLTALESVVEYGVGLRRGRVFADLWDVDRLTTCRCAPARIARLRTMNDTQRIPPSIPCAGAPRH